MSDFLTRTLTKNDKRREKESPKCYFCKTDCTDEDYCYGCGQYICSTCDETGAWGDHEPSDHKSEE